MTNCAATQQPASRRGAADLHARLKRAASGIDTVFSLSAVQTREVLRRRARDLASETLASGADDAKTEVIEIILAHEHYAIEACWVREVCPLVELTRLPGLPDFVLGIINLRSQVLSVLDLKKFFGLPDSGVTNLNRVVVMQHGDMTFGILADEIVGVRPLTLSAIQPAPPNLAGIRSEYLRGVTAGGLIVLDGERILSDPGIVVRYEPEL